MRIIKNKIDSLLIGIAIGIVIGTVASTIIVSSIKNKCDEVIKFEDGSSMCLIDLGMESK